MSRHTVVYSHGFGVDKTDRGLFSDIAKALPDYEHVLFAYNDVDKNNVLTISPFQEQVRRLNEQLTKLDDGEEKTIDIVAHSQGCVVAALAKPQNVRQVICLAPPDNLDVNRITGRFKDNPATTINLEGTSTIARLDGSTTIVPAAYWASIKPLDVIGLYNRLAGVNKVTFVVANQDDVLKQSNFDKTTEDIELEQLDGDHNFTGDDREALCNKVVELLK